MRSLQEQMLTSFTVLQDPLCDVCKNLFNGEVGSHATNFPHHRSASSLYKGIDLDCQVCILIWERLTEEQRQYLSRRANDAFELSKSHHYFGHVTREDVYKVYHIIIEVFGTKDPVEAIRIDLGLESVEDLPSVSSHRNVVHQSSAEALGLAQAWYARCCSQHSNCHREWPQDYSGPSRLIDISMRDNSLWKLCDTRGSDPERVSYFTLSHCWVGAMKQGLPLAHLPKTFQDAIYVARGLGASYIWIDSLCIMQDSVQDWRQEAAKMRDIYLYSACNIAATSASNSTEGCLFQREKQSTDQLWKVQAGPWTGNKNFVVLDLHKLASPIREAPLNYRGWVVQERILAPRTLHMGRSQIFWECDEGLACEFWPGAIPKAFEDAFGSMFRTTQKQLLQNSLNNAMLGDLSSTYRLWYEVVQRYSECHLTKASDKLVAISGIAQLFQTYLPNDSYIFGLWEADIAHGLLWRSATYGPSPLTRLPARAPSWSWASVDGSVEPQGRRYVINGQTILIQDIKMEPMRIATESIDQVNESTIELTGMLFECNFKDKDPKSPAGVFQPLSSKVASHVSGFLYPDTELRASFATRTFYCLPVLDILWRKSRMLKGLMLSPLDSSLTTFTRIGFWFIAPMKDTYHLSVFGTIADQFGQLGRVDSTVPQQRFKLI